MEKAANSKKRFVFVGSTAKGLLARSLPSSVWVCHDRSDLEAAVAHATKRMTWVSFTRSSTDLLLDRTVDAGVIGGQFGSRLITLTPPRAESVPALLGLFHPVFGLGGESRWLRPAELVAAITADDSADRFIGGSVDLKAKTVALVRGDITAVVAPFRLFGRSGDRRRPTFRGSNWRIMGGRSRCWRSEASADAVLYELDPQYRHRLNRERREQEQTFGAALFRLRKQRRLKRTDFLPISAKEIARISATRSKGRTAERSVSLPIAWPFAQTKSPAIDYQICPWSVDRCFRTGRLRELPIISDGGRTNHSTRTRSTS